MTDTMPIVPTPRRLPTRIRPTTEEHLVAVGRLEATVILRDQEIAALVRQLETSLCHRIVAFFTGR